MKTLQITRTNGNIPAPAEGEDHISGLLFYVGAQADVPTGFGTAPVNEVRTINQAEDLGITADSTSWIIKVMHYQIAEALRINPSVRIFVGVFVQKETPDYKEIETVQNYAEGAIRQMGIWEGTEAPTAANIALIEAVAEGLDEDNAPLSIGYAPKVASLAALKALTLVAEGRSRVSVIVAQDGGGEGAALFKATANTSAKNAVSAIGIWLGHLSAAKVNECIGWVKKFPSGISLPALSDGTPVRDIEQSDIQALDGKGYLFLVTHPGITGSYWNDSTTLDIATSDYAYIERVRVMDKAVRGIRKAITPELGGNIYTDAATGKMQAYTVAHLETVANSALEAMEKAGELSGYKAEIDPEQNVVQTSTIDIVIKQVPVGVMRHVSVKIGFAAQLS